MVDIYVVDMYESEKTHTLTTARLSPTVPPETSLTSPVSVPVVTSIERSWSEKVAAWLDPYTRLVVMGWLLGVALLSARLAGGLWYLARLKRLYTYPLPTWEATLTTLANRLGLRQPVRVLASGISKVPMVIGHLKPVILLPAALVTHLPADQIEAIIAHELAHVHRKDYWINLLQSVAEVVFFYHPAVWWLSSVIREEREKCCDDLAVALCGNTLTYAKALSEAEALQQVAVPFALAFAQRRSGLLARIERLVRPQRASSALAAKLLSMIFMLLTIMYLIVGDTLAGKSEKGEEWLENNFYPASSQQRPSTQTTEPKEDFPDDGWRRSDKAQSLRVPIHPDTIPDKEEARTKQESDSGNHFSFSFSDDGNFRLHIDSVFNMNVGGSDDPFFYLNFNGGDESYRKNFRHGQLHPNDTLPTFSWNDSLWLESIGELSEQMGAFSEELATYLKDSIDTEELQQRLGSVQQELSRLQAELGSSLQRSFNEERMEALRDKLQREQEQLQREMERIQRNLQRDQERAQERQREIHRRMEERQQEAERRRQEVRAQAHAQVHHNFDDTVQRLEKELLADGLIRKGKEYRFELKPKGLYINRKKQKEELREKYQDFLEVSESTNFSITRTAE